MFEKPPIKQNAEEIEKGKKEEVEGSEKENSDKFFETKEKPSPVENIDDRESIDRLRKEIQEKIKEKEREDLNLIASVRLPKEKGGEAIPLAEEQRRLIMQTVSKTKDNLALAYRKGFGIFPSASKESNFYGQVYARDSAHAAGNYFASANPEAMKDFLSTLLKHQRESGELPLRVEREYQILKLMPGLSSFARPAFAFFSQFIKGKKERPVYEGYDFGASGSEDTIPAVVIAAGEFFIVSKEGREFIRDHFNELEKALEFFKTKTDEEDGLAVITRNNPDWADSLKRKGKLGGINVWWARSLRMMEFMANQLGDKEKAQKYKKEFQEVKKSVLAKLYNSKEGYFRAKEGENRVDTAASIFGALYLLSPDEAVRVEETLERRVRHSSGLVNFDPPYSRQEIFGVHRLWSLLAHVQTAITGKKKWGMDDYHNRLVWPWITCENIQVKIKIALQHRDAAVRERYKKEAVNDFLGMSDIFEKAGGACEVLDPNKPERANLSMYSPPNNFMGTMSAYQGAYQQIKSLGWFDNPLNS